MSTNVPELINKTLGVNNCKTMYLGCTLMDTNPAAGREMVIADVKCPQAWSPLNALLLYPIIQDYEKSDKKKVDLSLACAWNTGFTPVRRGMPDAANMTSNSRNFLEGRSVNTTDQILKARSDDALAAIFSRIGWYGAKDSRIVPRELSSNEETDKKFVSRGFVSASWTDDPVKVRYMVSLPPTGSAPYDYVYLVGGSEDVIGDSLADIPLALSQMWDQIKTLKEEVKNSTKGKKSEADDEAASADPKFLWHAYTKQATDPAIRANLLAKKLLRTIESIIFIRNYFAYAKGGIGLNEVQEVVGFDAKEGKPILKTVNIDDVLQKYDTIYAYAKNLCYIFKDIGAGDIM
jgi:hypothetical protein